MRTPKDRLRHTLLFELLLLAICVPLTAALLDKPMHTMGMLSLMLSLSAMTWNYFYNVAFDHALLRLGRPLYPRSARLRFAHASLFEVGFMAVSVPMVMWWLGFGFIKAFAYDAVFMVAVPLYAVAFNWAYDVVFPPPSMQTAG